MDFGLVGYAGPIEPNLAKTSEGCQNLSPRTSGFFRWVLPMCIWSKMDLNTMSNMPCIEISRVTNAGTDYRLFCVDFHFCSFGVDSGMKE